MKKQLLAALSIVALLALPGCCKKKECSTKSEQCSMKKTCQEQPKKGCKTCKDKTMKPAQNKTVKKSHKKEEEETKLRYSYLELEAADNLLL